jgi:hypothetical protein
MCVFVEEGFVIVGADAEHLYSSGINEIANRTDQAVAVKLPFVAMAGRKGEQRRSPMAENRHTHVMPETGGMPVLMEDLHFSGQS